MDQFLETIWDNLLSHEPEKIQHAYQLLDNSSQVEVIDHLKKMVTEDGWHPEQVTSARIALNTLTGK